MKIAINQPYFYPYIGYFKLINKVDAFVVFSDAQYKKRSWISRNRIRSQHKEFQYINIPTIKCHRDTPIFDIKIDNSKVWRDKILKQLKYTYGKQVLFHPLVLHLSNLASDNLLTILKSTIENTCSFFNIKTTLLDSRNFTIKDFGLPNRYNKIISICKELNAETYVNLPGGVSIYDKEIFSKHGIRLEFSCMTSCYNKLSILDLCLGK